MTPEQAKYLLWQRGETSFKLHAGQKRINEAFESSTHMVFGCEVSRQFGKTSWGVWLADSIARKNPGCSIRIATAFYSDIKTIIRPAFNWLLSDCPREFQPDWRSSDGRYLYSNGSEILLLGLDKNPEKARGSRLRLILVEEAGFADSEKLRYFYEYVVIPATTHEPDARVVLISTPPPQGSDHSFCQLVDEAQLHSSYVKLTVYENPLLSADRIDEIAAKIGGKESIAFQREYLCRRVVDSTRAVVPEFLDEKHVKVSPRPEGFKYLHRYESLDSGVRDQTVALLAYYDFNRATLVVEDEVVLQGKDVDTRRIASEVKAKEALHWLEGDTVLPVYRRTADNDNLILIADLSREFQLHFHPTSKDSLEAMVNKLRLWFQDGRVEINPRCKHLIGTLRSALWNKTRNEFERSKTFGHADALASLMYLVRNVDVHTNPFPSLYGVDTQNAFINPLRPSPGQRTSKEARAFAEAFGLKHGR